MKVTREIDCKQYCCNGLKIHLFVETYWGTLKPFDVSELSNLLPLMSLKELFKSHFSPKKVILKSAIMSWEMGVFCSGFILLSVLMSTKLHPLILLPKDWLVYKICPIYKVTDQATPPGFKPWPFYSVIHWLEASFYFTSYIFLICKMGRTIVPCLSRFLLARPANVAKHFTHMTDTDPVWLHSLYRSQRVNPIAWNHVQSRIILKIL